MWDARILTGGVSTQRGPMSTAPGVVNPSGPFRPTPDALCAAPAAPHWPHCLLGNNGSVGGGKHSEEGTQRALLSPGFSPAHPRLSSVHKHRLVLSPWMEMTGAKVQFGTETSTDGSIKFSVRHQKPANQQLFCGKRLSQQRRLRSDTFGHTLENGMSVAFGR